MYDLTNFACMANDVYADSGKSEMLKDWDTNLISDVLNFENFRVRVYWRKGGIACVSFRGTANWQDAVISDLGAIGIGLNAFGLHLNTAVDFASSIAAKASVTWLTGHSLGGAYVQLVGAICNLPGISWNAPGVLALVNQMSSNPVRKIVGGMGSAGMEVLSSLASYGIGRHVVQYFNRAAAGMGNDAFPPVMNFRGHMDPVSLAGVHVGAPLQDIQVPNQSPHPHSMVPIITALQNRPGR